MMQVDFAYQLPEKLDYYFYYFLKIIEELVLVQQEKVPHSVKTQMILKITRNFSLFFESNVEKMKKCIFITIQRIRK